MVGQLLASEGFASVEEIAFVELDELAGIEGFDEETAGELQTRARDYLDKLEAEQDEERKALGVEDELKEVAGMTTGMLVALGKDDIKTVEDFAGSSPTTSSAGPSARTARATRHAGALDGFDLSRADAEAMIMEARVKAGWITEADLQPARSGRGGAEDPPKRRPA